MKHNSEIWMQAADNLVNHFIWIENKDYKHVNALFDALDKVADSIKHIDKRASLFISQRADAWIQKGMTEKPAFLFWWRELISDDAEKKDHEKESAKFAGVVNNSFSLDVALQQQLTTAGQRVKVMTAICEALTSEGKKLGIKGIRKEELEQIFSAISLITEIK